MRSDALPDVRIQFDSTRPIWINCQQKKKTFKVVSTCGRFIKLWRWRLVQTAATRHERIHQISKFYLFTSFFFQKEMKRSKRPTAILDFHSQVPTDRGTWTTKSHRGDSGSRSAIRSPVHSKNSVTHTRKGKKNFSSDGLCGRPRWHPLIHFTGPQKKLAALHSHRIN